MDRGSKYTPQGRVSFPHRVNGREWKSQSTDRAGVENQSTDRDLMAAAISGGWPERVDRGCSRAGRKPSISGAKIKKIVEAILRCKPSAAAHWSVRTMAAAQAVSAPTVQRIWDAHGLEPHRSRSFKLSRDKQFIEKLTDVVGLYLSPPDKAVVLSVDEKSQIQALNRTQPSPADEKKPLRSLHARL